MFKNIKICKSYLNCLCSGHAPYSFRTIGMPLGLFRNHSESNQILVYSLWFLPLFPQIGPYSTSCPGCYLYHRFLAIRYSVVPKPSYRVASQLFQYAFDGSSSMTGCYFIHFFLEFLQRGPMYSNSCPILSLP